MWHKEMLRKKELAAQSIKACLYGHFGQKKEEQYSVESAFCVKIEKKVGNSKQ
jgi:hypothetical protein